MKIRNGSLIGLCAALIVGCPAMLAQGSEYFFPHVADGGSAERFYSTCFLINNVFAIENPVRIRLFRSNGTAWSLEMRSIDRPEVAGRRTEFAFTLNPHETVILFTSGTGALQVGWARIDADFPINASENFGVFKTSTATALGSEASVLASPTATEFTFTAVVSENEPVDGTNTDTGFAVANPSGASAQITATLTAGDGHQAGKKIILVGPGRQTAIFVSQVFDDIRFTGQFHGMVNLSSNVNVSVVALRQTSGNSDTLSTMSVTADSTTGYSIVYDREPNDNLADAQPLLALPAQVVGTMNAPDDGPDVDFFSLSLQAGDVLYVFAVAEMINSTLNDSIIIRNPSGAAVADVDTFSAGLLDPFVRYEVPSDGIYYIDHGSVGGTSQRSSHYRLHVLLKTP